MYSLNGSLREMGYAMLPVSPKLLPTWSHPTTCLQTWLVIAVFIWFLSPPTWTNLAGVHRRVLITVNSGFDSISLRLLREKFATKFISYQLFHSSHAYHKITIIAT